MNPGHLSIKYHTWFANVSGMLVKEVCTSQIVNKCHACSRAGPYILSLVLIPLWAAGEPWDSSCLKMSKCSDVSKETLTCVIHVS